MLYLDCIFMTIQLKRYTRIKPADLLDKINKVNVVKLIG